MSNEDPSNRDPTRESGDAPQATFMGRPLRFRNVVWEFADSRKGWIRGAHFFNVYGISKNAESQESPDPPTSNRKHPPKRGFVAVPYDIGRRHRPLCLGRTFRLPWDQKVYPNPSLYMVDRDLWTTGGASRQAAIQDYKQLDEAERPVFGYFNRDLSISDGLTSDGSASDGSASDGSTSDDSIIDLSTIIYPGPGSASLPAEEYRFKVIPGQDLFILPWGCLDDMATCCPLVTVNPVPPQPISYRLANVAFEFQFELGRLRAWKSKWNDNLLDEIQERLRELNLEERPYTGHSDDLVDNLKEALLQWALALEEGNRSLPGSANTTMIWFIDYNITRREDSIDNRGDEIVFHAIDRKYTVVWSRFLGIDQRSRWNDEVDYGWWNGFPAPGVANRVKMPASTIEVVDRTELMIGYF